MRNSSLIYGFVLLLACGCGERATHDASIPDPNAVVLTAAIQEGNIDLEESVIHWKGTKMGKLRHHEGYLKLRAGNLFVENGRIRSGYFIADMATLQVTDIPAHETQARANLIRHLKSDFGVRSFPYSRFTITMVRPAGNLQQVCGDLQIRDTVRPICFEVVEGGNSYTADLVLNRTDWQIGADGSWLEERLVDDAFSLRVVLYVK